MYYRDVLLICSLVSFCCLLINTFVISLTVRHSSPYIILYAIHIIIWLVIKFHDSCQVCGQGIIATFPTNIRLEVCRDIAIGFSFSWLDLRVGGHCLEWLAVGISRFLIYLALSPHLIIWSCEAVCPYGSRVCHGLPNRLWVAWVSRLKCRYLDTQLWELYLYFYQISVGNMYHWGTFVDSFTRVPHLTKIHFAGASQSK